MTIDCETLTQFLDIIEGLVKRGIGFEANAYHFTIKLTGAY